MAKAVKPYPKKINYFLIANSFYLFILVVFYLVAPKFLNVTFVKIVVLVIASYLIFIGYYIGFILKKIPRIQFDAFNEIVETPAKFIGIIMIIAGILFILAIL